MVGIYVRLSAEDDEGNSIENQLREGKAFADNSNLSYQIYNEGQGVSGRADIKDRPELDRLMKDIASGNIKSVWFRNQNRLERNSETFILFSTLAKRKKLKVYFGDKAVNWDDPTSFLQSSILTAINSYQAELQSVQTKKVLFDNFKEGKASGTIPFGYLSDEKGYFKINDNEADIVRRIFKMSLEGKGSHVIAKTLSKEGVPTRYNTLKGTVNIKNRQTGKITTKEKSKINWASSSVRYIIKNSKYKGEWKWNGKSYNFESLAIFEPHYWQKVNDNLKKNAYKSGKKVDHIYLLKGLLECAKCGMNISGKKRLNKKSNAYECGSKRNGKLSCGSRAINIDFLENDIFNRFLKGDQLLRIVRDSIKNNSLEERIIRIEKDITEKQKELKSIEIKRKKAIRLAIEGVLSDEDIREEVKTFDIKAGDLNREIENKLDEISFLSKSLEAKDNILEDVASIKDNIDFNTKKELIHKYIRRIYILWKPEWDEHIITVKFNLPIPDEQYVTARGRKIKDLQLDSKEYYMKEGIIYKR